MDTQIWDETPEKIEKSVFRLSLGAFVGLTSVLTLMACSYLGEKENTSQTNETQIVYDNPMIEYENMVFIERKEDATESDVFLEEVQVFNESEYIYYNVPMEDALQEYTQELCLAMEVHYPLVLAIISTESRFDASIISEMNSNGSYDYGIMQINSGNHEWLEREINVHDWLNPYQNIFAGVYILSEYAQLGTNYQQIAMYYNSGPSGAKKLIKQGIYTPYSHEVIKTMAEIEERRREVPEDG